MKRISLLLLSLLSIQSLIAQVSWFNPDDRWTFYVRAGWVGKGIEQIQYEKDTVISGLTYKKLMRSRNYASAIHTGFRMMRQDGKKIYIRSHTVINGQEEMLLYDFALQVGDTVRFTAEYPQQFGYVITGISTIFIGGQERVHQAIKWLDLPPHIPYKKGVFIEGLGSVQGAKVVNGQDQLSNSYLFLDEPPGISADSPEQTFCSFQSGATTFEGLGIALCKTLPTDDPLQNPVYVYPNPSAGTLHFSSMIPGSDYQVTLYDLAGKQIMQSTLNGDDMITTLVKGTAIVIIQAGEHRMMKRVVFF